MATNRLIPNLMWNFINRLRQSSQTARLLKRYQHSNLKIGRNCFLKRCRFGRFNRIYDDCRLVDVSLGTRSYVSEESRLFNVNIGKFCAVGPRVTIGLGIHPSRTFVSIHPLFYSKSNSACTEPISDGDYFTEFQPVSIGHDVWIGAETIIRDGVSVGNGAIIGSGAVVTRDIPPYAVVAGVPAKVMRFRFNAKQTGFLERFCWWDKDEAWLKNNWRKFHNIEVFIRENPINRMGDET